LCVINMSEDEANVFVDPSSPKALFSWQQEPAAVPYHMQGNSRFETEAAKTRRQLIMYDAAVRDAITRYWSITPKTEAGRVSKAVYTGVCLRISKVILPGFSEEESKKVIEDDWANDSQGAETLDYFLFYRAIFQLADIWTNSLDVKEYVDFLIKIFRRITARKIIHLDGSVQVKHRSIKVVFPDRPKEKELEGWEEVAEGSDDEAFEYRVVEDQSGQKKRVKRLKREGEDEEEEKAKGLEMLYDEVVESDWEDEEEMGVLELADLENIVPIGKAVEAYIAHVKHSATSPVKKGEEDFVELNTGGKQQITAVLKPEMRKLILEGLLGNNLKLKKGIQVETQEGVQMVEENTPKPARLYDISVSFLTNSKVLNVWKNKFQMYSFLKKPAEPSQSEAPSLESTQQVPEESKSAEQPTIVSIRKALLEQKYGPSGPAEEKAPVPPPANPSRLPPKRAITSIAPEFLSEEFWLREDPVNSDQDIVTIAAKPQLQMLILGKPRSGKTTLAKELEASLHVNHIEPAALIDQIFAKLKPPEEGFDEEENPAPKLTPLEQEIVNTLKEGKAVTLAQQLGLVKAAVHSDLSKKNGFVLDVTLASEDHLSLMEQLDINFSHVIELDVSDSDLLRVNEGILQDPESAKVYSRWERAEVQKPKPKPVKTDEDDSGVEEEEETEPPPKLPVDSFVQRAEDAPATLLGQAGAYATQVRPQLTPFLSELPPNGLITIASAGLSPGELRAIVEAELGYRTKNLPMVKKLEPASDSKELLTSELEEGKEPRQWSLWKQIDPVALAMGKVVIGKPDLGTEFAGKVFVFDSEENQSKFLANPRPYLSAPPKLPGQHRVLLLGGRMAGKHTQAAYLTAKYGWKTVDMNDLLYEIADKQRNSVAEPHPSHPDSGLVQFFGPDFEKLMKGEAVPGNTILPLFLSHLQVPLYKKPPPPPEPVEGEEQQAEESKQDPASAEKKPGADDSSESEGSVHAEEPEKPAEFKPTDEDLPVQPTTPEPIIYEDLPLTEIVPKPNPDGSMPSAGGFILIGYPGMEEEVQAMKDTFVGLDKVIYLSDPTGGDELKKRGAEDDCELDKELEQVEKTVGLVRDGFGDEIFVEISCVGDELAIHRRICAILDPFALLPDDESTIRVKADVQEEDLPLPYGDGGHYDPVILLHEAWLMPGSADFEAYVMGRRYNFVSEKELEQFKSFPADYVRGKLALPPPHVMLLGVRGAGLHTQMEMLRQQFMIDTLELKEKFMEQAIKTRKARRHRRFLARGFIAPDPRDDDDPEPIPNPEETDPQILEEDEDFDQAAHEQKLIRGLLPGPQPVFMNGNWFEVDAELASSAYVDLLHASRKLPEVVIMYTVDEETIVKRNLNTAAIQQKYEEIMAQRKAEKEKAKEEERKRRLEEGEEMPPDEPEEDEEDPDAPKLPEMIEEEKTKLLARRNEDLNLIEEWKNAFEDKGVPVVLIDTGSERERINRNTVFELEAYLHDRLHLIERELVAALTPQKAADMLARNLLQLSAFKEMSPITPNEMPVTYDYPAVYRQRLYYFKNLEELKEFKKRPRKYADVTDTPPWDGKFPPRLCILGPPSSGKSYLANAIYAKIGAVPVSSKQAIVDLLETDSILAHEIRELLQLGQPLSEEYKVKAVLARLRKADTMEKGFILCDFPTNMKEAQILAENGVIPNPVICLTLSTAKIMERAAKRSCFKNNFRVIKKRFELQPKLQEVLAWYQNTWGSVHYLTSERSKWWLEDSTMEAVNKVFEAKRKFAISLVKKSPAVIKNVGLPRKDIASRLCKFQRFDPVVWRLAGELEHVAHSDFVVMYRDEYYYFASKDNMEAFIATPEPFAQFQDLPEALPYRLSPAECGEVNPSSIALENHCVVTLAKTGKLDKGNSFHIISYKGKFFTFRSPREAQEFFKRPWTFEDTKLPKKMPPKPTKVNVLDDYKTYISYMEEHVGLTISKALLEVGSVRLLYPTIHTHESALKYLALYLKANNQRTTNYQRDKYKRKMQEFRKDCELEEALIEEGFKKHEFEAGGNWYTWDDATYFRKGEEYEKLLAGVQQAGKRYFRKFISY
jgi:adenylate/nucleoside-diphosphate kinase